ncbi:pesticin C-terminus-like muramidase [Bradyrhizobium sp. USDA 4545]|uniref:pesticin C-terminus-like muramidase n=1 Tax=Bradyrhizobium sp. USDA 4545 TaxID=2817705 RepID=UPI0020A34422|nr:pesticin C-terminus-like muramidase [Bradyrhizobium sp. USDA 4545]MCP1832848.1 hypothetical protein [Bradyrhizobium sp. USDA 4545]
MTSGTVSASALDLHGISRAAFDLIVDEEVSGRETYDKKYVHPEKPGGQSGVTVGIGYDCGYYSAAQIRRDWGGHLSQAMVDALASCAGIRGDAAFAACDRVHSIVAVPWDAAIAVFSNVSIPKYLASTRNGLPNFDALPPDCKGALLSLVYNRGASFTTAGDRYSEMRAIRAAMAASNFASIPALFRRMKRLWTTKSVRGVALRREHEARLFEQGLATLHQGILAEPAADDAEDGQGDPAAPFPADGASDAPDTARAAIDPETVGDPELFAVQKRLKGRHYSPGVLDGKWGSGISGALSGFANDRHLAIGQPTSIADFRAVQETVKADLTWCEENDWYRPVTADRKNADPGTVATVAPEVVGAKRSYFATLWASILTFFAGIANWISDKASGAWDFFVGHKDDLGDPSSLMSYAREVPTIVWFVIAGGVLLWIALEARDSVKKITSSVQTGARQ